MEITARMSRSKTIALYQASCSLIPGGVNSPVRAFSSLDMTPLMASEGLGDTLWDVDRHAYIDYCCSFGSLILGHAPKSVVLAATAQMGRGSSFGVGTPYEFSLAEKIIKYFPSIEKIRFVSSGTEAVMSAIRLARGFTNRPVIVKFNGHYHGHSDSLLVQAGSGVTELAESSSKGVLKEVVQHTLSLPFNNIETGRSVLSSRKDIAAVLIEPIAGNMGVVPSDPKFLEMLREETTKSGALLIFDEVITGFRIGLKGAQSLYGIKPDLTCLGKIIGGGFPAAAFGGSHEIMNLLAPLGPVYQAGTLSGNPVAMCAGLATLEELLAPQFYEELERKTRLLTDPIEECIKEHGIKAVLNRVGSMFTLFFGPTQVTESSDLNNLDAARFKAFFHYLFNRGIYIPPAMYEASFISSAHTEEHLLYTRDVILEFLRNPCLQDS